MMTESKGTIKNTYRIRDTDFSNHYIKLNQNDSTYNALAPF